MSRKDDEIGCLLQIIIILIFVIMYIIAHIHFGELMDVF